METTKMELDTAVALWTKSPGEQSFELSSFEDNIPENSIDKW